MSGLNVSFIKVEDLAEDPLVNERVYLCGFKGPGEHASSGMRDAGERDCPRPRGGIAFI